MRSWHRAARVVMVEMKIAVGLVVAAIAAMLVWIALAPSMGRKAGEAHFGAGPPGRAIEEEVDRRTPEKIAEDAAKAEAALAEEGRARVRAREAAEQRGEAPTFALQAPSLATPGVVRAIDLGDRWPLTVSEGVVSCVGEGGGLGAAIFTSGGVRYALNGIARGERNMKRLQLKEIRPIWRDNPDIPGTKINIGPLIDRALETCPK